MTPIALDVVNQTLVKGTEQIQLPPKVFGMLKYLSQHPQQLVTKEELLNAVWPGVFVTDAVLKVAIADLRKALHDDPKQPLYIETVHRRGYRFIGQLTLRDTTSAYSSKANTAVVNAAQPIQHASHDIMVGREIECQQLSAAWQAAQTGQRQVVMLQAEAGFGKSTLIHSWLSATVVLLNVILSKAQCLEQYGQSEAYQPFLDSLSALLQSSQSELVRTTLQQFAPLWLMQLPAVLLPTPPQHLQQETFGATQGRLLREFAEFIEQLSQQVPIILLLEDLQWCDAASIELLLTLAYRHNPARLCLIATFRPSDLTQAKGQRLKAALGELTLQHKCRNIVLEALPASCIPALIRAALPTYSDTQGLADLLLRYTEGNPLFVFTALEHIKQALTHTTANDRQALALPSLEGYISGGLKQLLDLKMAALLADELSLLQAASIAVSRITSEGIAAILQQDVLEIEDQLEKMLLKGFWLLPLGAYQLPDGSRCESYRFRHQLYREVFYTNLSAARRRHYHLRLAKRLHIACQQDVDEFATKLAYHFEQGGDTQQAIPFWQQACQVASRRFAYVEAIQHIERILALLPATEQTARLAAFEQRCTLLVASGNLREAITAYQQLITTSQQQQQTAYTTRALAGLAGVLFWLDRQQCLKVGQQAVECSDNHGDKALSISVRGKLAHWQAIIQGYQPEHAHAYEQAMQLAEQTQDVNLKCTHSVLYLYYLTIRSDYTRACDIAQTVRQLTRESGDIMNYLASGFFQAWALYYRGQWGDMGQLVEQSLAFVQKNAHQPWIMHFQLQQAWLHMQALDAVGAQQLCLPIYQAVQQLPLKNSGYFFSLIILLHTAVQLDDLATAGVYQQLLQSELERDNQAIDWVLKLPLYQGFMNYFLKQQLWETAHYYAQQLLTLANQSQEHTYQILALLGLAQACQAQDSAPAQAYLQQAHAYAQANDVPVAAWRLYAVQGHWSASKAIVQPLLASLQTYPALQHSFSQEPLLKQVLAHA